VNNTIIGQVLASSATDSRVSQAIDVCMRPSGSLVAFTITLRESYPDEGGQIHWKKVSESRLDGGGAETLQAGAIISIIKHLLKGPAHIIKANGRPTKSFVWYGTTLKGLSTMACTEAIVVATT